MISTEKLPITVLLAVKNEEQNINRCLSALNPVEKIFVIDSQSTDKTPEIAAKHSAEIVQFEYNGKHPKKRQWAIENIPVETEWIMLLDADEIVSRELWAEIRYSLLTPLHDAYLIMKGFHFMGKRFKFGGFSHSAILLFKKGKARFERLVDEAENDLDMEVHERLLVDGEVARLKTPLIHEDFKGLEAYIKQHEKYADWEARARFLYITKGTWGDDSGVKPSISGNVQERRRLLKSMLISMPFEPIIWFVYHYFCRLGFLEGKPGFVASKIRAQYISMVRKKLKELLCENSTD